MKKPKMILFDYGHTLLYEPQLDFLRAEKALAPYITENPRNLTPEQVNEFAARLYAQAAPARAAGAELHERQMKRLVYESLGIQFSISYAEIERIQWNTASPGALMPDADQLLSCLEKHGVRSGVISNIGWSGAALTERLNRLLPGNAFEFVIASSEYGFRKPSPYLFQLALQKAGLPAQDVWFCGDNPKADVEGAAGAGIFPVWYDNGLECTYRDRTCEAPPACEHLHIREWSELIALLEGLA